jgi:hypothetical protein
VSAGASHRILPFGRGEMGMSVDDHRPAFTIFHQDSILSRGLSHGSYVSLTFDERLYPRISYLNQRCHWWKNMGLLAKLFSPVLTFTL